MPISKKYSLRLTNYLQWNLCTTPTSIHEASKAALPPVLLRGGNVTAAAWLWHYETHGERGAECNDVELLRKYWAGKANRDWWTKQIGWWDREAVYLPEEFLAHLMPLCFIELFGRAPITTHVRHFYDNGYSLTSFKIDQWLKSKRYLDLVGFERDDRHEWPAVVAYIVRRKLRDWCWKLFNFRLLRRLKQTA